jgi:lysyl-tRNA synthetase class 2
MAATAEMARARARLFSLLRRELESRGSLEVETPIAVPVAGQEPHLRPFATRFTPDLPVPPGGVERARSLHLHTSPEYAMKRLVARGEFPRVHQFARVFRDGEVSRTHNPEFTLLEFYFSPGDAALIMRELEEMIAACAEGWHTNRTDPYDLRAPFERLTCQDAFLRHAGFDPLPLDAASMIQAGRSAGVRISEGTSWDDAFTQVLLEKVEPNLGAVRPTYLHDYPISQAALAKRSARDPRVAERFELYANGLELCNGFSELTDAAEQRARFEEEQEMRRALGRAEFPLDEQLLAALPSMPETGGVAVGFDRLLMLLTGAKEIADVLLFPACEEYPHAPLAEGDSR